MSAVFLQLIKTIKELDKNTTTDKYAVVQKGGQRNVKRDILHYNLDTIRISF